MTEIMTQQNIYKQHQQLISEIKDIQTRLRSGKPVLKLEIDTMIDKISGFEQITKAIIDSVPKQMHRILKIDGIFKKTIEAINKDLNDPRQFVLEDGKYRCVDVK